MTDARNALPIWRRLLVAASVLFMAGTGFGEDGTDKSDMRISFAAVGDMMIGTEYPQNRLPPDDGATVFDKVTPWLSAADITFGNLEGVLADAGEPGKKCSNPAACYRFRMPTRYAAHFKAAGFDVLSLANNHARDFGEEGRTTTMRTLADAGLLYSGRVGNYSSFEKNGLKIAVLAYAVTRNSNMMLDYLYAERIVGKFAATHDIVVVSFHGGAEGADYTHVTFDEEEYYGEPRGDVVRFARTVVDAGADLVLGSGPHVVRAMERYNDRLIAYSLGNFATGFGISIAGAKGTAPILLATLDGEGRFIEGEIVSTEQRRPSGVFPDPARRALNQVRKLSQEDFGEPGLEFAADGKLLPAERPTVVRRTEFGADDNPGDDGPLTCKEDWFWLVESTLVKPGEIAFDIEPGTEPWRALVEQRLEISGNADLPARESDDWCHYVGRQLAGEI